MKYYSCPYCGANLDPGERCDCKRKEAELLTQNRPQDKTPTHILADVPTVVK